MDSMKYAATCVVIASAIFAWSSFRNSEATEASPDRYQIVNTGTIKTDGNGVTVSAWIIDKQTGSVRLCSADPNGGALVHCTQ